MTGETMRELLEPLIDQYASISILFRRTEPVAFALAGQNLTGVEVRSDGLVRLEREHGGAVIDPDEVVAVVWND